MKTIIAGILLTAISSVAHAQGGTARSQPLQPSPGWDRAMPPGPDTRVKITEEYAKLVGRDAYFWAWPMVNMYNRRLHFMRVKEMAVRGSLARQDVRHYAGLLSAGRA
jgi:hypothetical protein